MDQHTQLPSRSEGTLTCQKEKAAWGKGGSGMEEALERFGWNPGETPKEVSVHVFPYFKLNPGKKHLGLKGLIYWL